MSGLRRFRVAVMLLAFQALLLHYCHAQPLIRYPLTSGGIDSRYDYAWDVLRTALRKTEAHYGPCLVQQYDVPMSPQRITQELRSPAGHINILARATDPALEKEFLPVRLPIDRGLLGYRIFLVRADLLPRFAAVRTLDQLRQLRAGVGKDWADTEILRAAGLPYVEGRNYDGLFAMLDVGRFDYFSRGVDEAMRELGERRPQYPQLVVEPTLLLHYPLPSYFFLRRDAEGQRLAQRITQGLEIMIKDGSLEHLFEHYKRDMIKQAGLRQRRILDIPNPTLSPHTPLARKELWYNPVTGK